MERMSKQTQHTSAELFTEFLDILALLRSPDGCPWDREQTTISMRGCLLEETYEAIEAIDEEDDEHLREELGDVFLIICMLARIEEENNSFTIADVIQEITAKLIRRHPHVFGDEKVKDADEVLENWERIKVDIEGRKKSESVLDGVPRSFPPLERSWKLQKKAAKNGFDWKNAEGPKQKIFEELKEIDEALRNSEKTKLEEEVGDLLFSVVNYARHLGVEPSLALARTNVKFEKRFRDVEENMLLDGVEMKKENLEIMDRYWEKAKLG